MPSSPNRSMQQFQMRMFNSADASLPTEPSGPGLPITEFERPRIVVRRPTSASIQSFITRSLMTRRSVTSSSGARFSHSFMSMLMLPDPRGAVEPPRATRSFISVVVATRQPSPTAPSRFEWGTRTSVKNTSLNSAFPVIWKSGRISTPGECMSRMKYESPLCFGTSGSVRTSSMPKRA